MHTQKYLKLTATPIRTVCILLVVMFLLAFLQMIVVQLHNEFRTAKYSQEYAVPELTGLEKQQMEINNAVKSFSEDGTLYLVNTENTLGILNETKMIVKDRSGNILFEGKEQDCPYSFIQWQPKNKEGNYVYYDNIDQRYLNQLDIVGPEFSRMLIVPVVNPSNKRIGHWIYDTEKQIFKYYSIDGQPGGCLGANGYVETDTTAVGFEECRKMESWLQPNSYDPMMLYQTRYALYQIDFQNKKVETLVNTRNDPIVRIQLANWREQGIYDYRPSLSVFTEARKGYLFLKNPDQKITIQLPDEFRYLGTASFAANKNTIFAECQKLIGIPQTDDQQVISEWLQKNRYKAQEYIVSLYEVDTNGAFTEKSSFTWTCPVRPESEQWMAQRRSQQMIREAGNIFSSPIPVWIIMQWIRTGTYNSQIFQNQAIIFISEYSAFKLPINLCAMALFAALTFLHQWPRRTHTTKLAFWIVFVFLFNLPGFLTYLALNHSPIIRCEHCGKKRGLLQDACCHCKTALPRPKRKETDLIMPLSA